MTGDLNGADIQLVLKQCNSNFVTYVLDPGICTIKDLQAAVHPLDDHEESFKNEYDDVSMKTKLVLTCFDGTFGTLRFEKKIFFQYFIGFYTILGL